MRARLPDREGVIMRDGVRVAFEIFGHGEPALLLIPASPITHARSWKGVVPALARRFTVVTTDGRGTGRSDRPRTPDRYAPAEMIADLLAVLDAADMDRAVLVAHCHAVPWALRLAADHPGRAAGVVAIAPGIGVAPPYPYAAEAEQLGYRDDELVCVATVGGSGVGRALLDKVVAAYPLAKKAVPELRMIVVTGPRIDPATFPGRAGLELHGYVHRLYEHLCACDLAIVQGGLTTTMELTAAKRPFLYFPLGHHFEQNFHVRHRLDRYGAGTCMDYLATDPDLIAARIAELAGKPVSYRDVETDGAARAARLIAELI